MRETAVGPQMYEIHSQTIGFLGHVVFDLESLPITHDALIWIITDRPAELAAA